MHVVEALQCEQRLLKIVVAVVVVVQSGVSRSHEQNGF